MSDTYKEQNAIDSFLQIYQDLECAEVRQMHDKFGGPSENVPTIPTSVETMIARGNFLLEELNEFIDAAIANDVPAMADALVDLVYVAKGTAIMLGLPWGSLWKDVHQCNMNKVRGNNSKREGMEFDLVKPSWWKPPQTMHILVEYGFVDKREE